VQTAANITEQFGRKKHVEGNYEIYERFPRTIVILRTRGIVAVANG